MEESVPNSLYTSSRSPVAALEENMRRMASGTSSPGKWITPAQTAKECSEKIEKSGGAQDTGSNHQADQRGNDLYHRAKPSFAPRIKQS